MNPMVQKEYSLRTTRQRTCPNCKTGVFCRECNTEIHDSDGSSGIRHIVTEILQSSEDEAKKLREKRNSIVHGYAEFSSVFQDLNAMTELAQRAGIAGVLTVLGFPQQDIAGYLRGMLPLVGSRRAIVTAILYDLPIDLLKTGGKYPQLYLQYAEIAVPNRIETYRGELRPLASELHIGIRDFSGAWDLIELQVWPMIDPDDPASQTGVRATKVAES